MARPSARLGARRRDEAPRDLRVVVAEPRLDRELGSLAPQSGSDTASGSPTTSIQQPRAMARYASGSAGPGGRSACCSKNRSIPDGVNITRILVMFTPSGMERFFEQHADLPPGPADPDAYRAIARGCWMEVVGEPLAVSDPL